jgi:hypothetical protein
MAADADQVLIRSGDGDYVALTRLVGKPAGPGYPATIEVVSGSLRGSVNTDLWCLGEFYKQLVDLERALTGEASLWSCGEFDLKMRGDGRGHIKITGMLSAMPASSNRLEFEMSTDQTFLPEAIMALKRVFLDEPPPEAWLYYPATTRIVPKQSLWGRLISSWTNRSAR